MNTIKYTREGKKVVVIDKINEKDYVVQEVFVAGDNNEFPSGEKFVAKDLLDVAPETWQDNRLRELRQRYDKDRVKFESLIEQQTKKFNETIGRLRIKTNAFESLLKNSEAEQLDILIAFLNNEIKYLYVKNYEPKIIPFDDLAFQNDDYSYKPEALKLISLFGASDGKLNYNLNRYKDGSGFYIHIIPTRTYEEALKHAQKDFDDLCREYINSNKLFDIEKWKKIEGIKVSQEVIEKEKKETRQNNLARLEKLKQQITELENKL